MAGVEAQVAEEVVAEREADRSSFNALRVFGDAVDAE